MSEKLIDRIRKREALVAVMGLGYVGLPLVRLLLSKGFRVTGFDTDRKKIDKLSGGESYIQSVPDEIIRGEAFSATDDPKELGKADVIIICVPTPLTGEGEPDLSHIRSTAKTIGDHFSDGCLVVLESSTYPGTTREVMLPELERDSKKCGRDFFLAFSPEREDPGNKEFSNAIIPKLVGGIDDPSRKAAAALYGEIVSAVHEVSSCDVAEAAKLLENIYRCVNIAMVNEMKMCFDKMGIDVWEVISAAATKPFGFQAFYPGPGMGGHCIPVDPFYLAWRAREFGFATRFIELAGEINTQMPFYVVSKVEEALGTPLKGAKVLLLGLSYKKDIDDPRESPSFKILERLLGKGAEVVFHDPFYDSFPSMRHYGHLEVSPVDLTEEELKKADVVVLATDHSSFDYPFIAKHARKIVDTRNAFDGVGGTITKA